jgi:hypothetical protein
MARPRGFEPLTFAFEANLGLALAYPIIRYSTLSLDNTLIRRTYSGHKAALSCDLTLHSFLSNGEFLVSFFGALKCRS